MWEDFLRIQFKPLGIEFQEIVFIEEVEEYGIYSAFARIKSNSDKNEFIEISVVFNKKGSPLVTLYPSVIHSIDYYIAGGKVLFNKLSTDR
jgi:hypothetical protein